MKHPLIASMNIYDQIKVFNNLQKRYRVAPWWIEWAVFCGIVCAVVLCNFGALSIAIRAWEKYSPPGVAFPMGPAGTVVTVFCGIGCWLVNTYFWWIPMMNDRLNRAARDGICLFCGYTLGMPEADRCPECGKAVVGGPRAAAPAEPA